MIASTEFYTKLGDYIDRHVTAAELEAWLAPRLRTILSAPDSAVAHDAATVELCLAELADGVRDERGTRAFLKEHLGNRLKVRLVVTQGGSPSQSSTGSLSRWVSPPAWFVPQSGARTEPQGAPA